MYNVHVSDPRSTTRSCVRRIIPVNEMIELMSTAELPNISYGDVVKEFNQKRRNDVPKTIGVYTGKIKRMNWLK